MKTNKFSVKGLLKSMTQAVEKLYEDGETTVATVEIEIIGIDPKKLDGIMYSLVSNQVNVTIEAIDN